MKNIVFAFILFPLSLTSQDKTDLYLLIGQSNMAGRATIEVEDTLTLDKVLLLNEQNDLLPAKNPLNIHSSIRKDKAELQRLCPAYYFGKAISESINDTIALIVQARGGTPIEKWIKGSNYAYYEAALNRTRNALKKHPHLRLRAIFWQQGESNRHNPGAYLPQLRKLITDFRKDLALPELPFFVGEMGKWNHDYDAIREKILASPDSIPNVFLVSAEGLSNMDVHHFDAKSQRILGKRYAQLCEAVIHKKQKSLLSRAEQLIQRLQNPSDNYVMVVAHRGDWRHFPENSLPAIQNCITMGVDMVEIDVRLTKDSIPVLLHDKRLDRTTTGTGLVSDYTYREIQKLYLRNGMGHPTEWTIPTLEEAMKLSKGKILVNLDKADEIIPVIFPILKKTGTINQVAIGSYQALNEMREKVGVYLDSIYFMPKLSDDSKHIHQYLNEYFSNLNTPIVQVKFKQENSPVRDHLNFIKASKKWLWLNTITADRSANHHDNRATYDIEGSYSWVIRNGFNMIQTDRPQLLLDYLRKKGLHD